MLDLKNIFLTLGVAIIIVGGIAVGMVNMAGAAYTGYANNTGTAGYGVAQALNSGAAGFSGFISTWVPLIIVFIGIGVAVYYLLMLLGGAGSR